MRKITSFQTAILLLLVHSVLLPSPAGAALRDEDNSNNDMESTCKQTPSYDLCLQTLLSNPKSSGADVAGLGLVVIDAMSTEAARTLKSIDDLIRKGGGGAVVAALRSCRDKYDAVLKADVPEAVEALTKGNPKFAESGARDAAIEADSCERDLGAKSPLSLSNRHLHDLSLVAASIARLLL